MPRKLMILFCLLISCGTKLDNSDGKGEILENILTHEVTFGSDETLLPSEYLLAQPRDIDVDNEGNIYVLDESRIKVFNSRGEPVSIFSGPGQGPEELQNPISMIIGEKGNIMVCSYVDITVFNDKGEYIRKTTHANDTVLEKYKKQTGSGLIYTIMAFYIDEYSDVRIAYSGFTENNHMYLNYLAVYINRDTTIELCSYQLKSAVVIGNNFANIPNISNFFADMLDGKRVVFSDPLNNGEKDTGEFTYTFTIYSTESGESVDITHPYTPVAVPDSIRENYARNYEKKHNPPAPLSDEIRNKLQEELDNTPFIPAISNIHTDGNTIFIYTSEYGEKERVADVFNADTGKYLRTIRFSMNPRTIKNGFCYTIGKNDDGFYVIEKYRIDPAVYLK